jgi:hypothetical protein
VAVNGGAGQDDVTFLNQCVLDGPLSVQLGEGDNHLFFSVTSNNERSTVNGAFSYVGGSVRDFIQARGRYLGSVDMQTGSGDDFVFYFGSSASNSVSINTGTEDDTVKLAGEMGTGVIDGGSEYDELDRNINSDVSRLSLLNFEQETITA